jgi:RHS repeat-associated protein
VKLFFEGVLGLEKSYSKSCAGKYRYGYQGKYAEKDEETGWNHFELREYDAVIGRWTSKDPKAQYYSPYVGMGNNPVSSVDSDGGLSINNMLFDLYTTLNSTIFQYRYWTGDMTPYSSKHNETFWGFNEEPSERYMLYMIDRAKNPDYWKDFDSKMGTIAGVIAFFTPGQSLLNLFKGKATQTVVSSSAVAIESQLLKKGIVGFTEHATEQMTLRGFSNEAVLKIVTEGTVKPLVYKGQAQIHYVLGQYKVAVEVSGRNAGKVVTVMGDYNTIFNGVRGVFKGF